MTAATVQRVETETVVLLPVEQLHKSPSQPRRRGGDKPMDPDFVASIKEKGVIQPIVVRPIGTAAKGPAWEVVFGHRRWEGSKLAGRETIPAIERNLTDDEVFEAQLIENVHREDMHPLDEADGFQRMIEKGKKTVQQVADRVGRSVSYVAQRLKLCELSKDVRAALDNGKINLGVAVLVARVPAGLQADALREVGPRWNGEAITTSEAKRALEAKFLLRLDQAPFDVADAQLVAKAGACVACPKRTGQQRDLFPDVKKDDLCTDPVCFRSKLDAVWQIKVTAAKTGGQPVLEGKEAKEAMQVYGSAWRKLDDTEWVAGKEKKLRTLLGKYLPPIALVRDQQTGAIVEVVKRADAAKVLKQDRGTSVTSDDGVDSYREQQRREAAKDNLREAAVGLAISKAVEKVAKLTDTKLIKLLVHVLIDLTWTDGQAVILLRHGLGEKEKGDKYMGAEERLQKYFRTLTKPDQVAGLGLELALQNLAPDKWSSQEPAWDETLKTLGVDFAAIQRQLAAEEKARKKEKKAKKGKAPKKAA